MKNTPTTLNQLLQDGHPNVLLAGLELHPHAKSNSRYQMLLVALSSDTRKWIKDVRTNAANNESLVRKRQRLLDRMGVFLDLFDLHEYTLTDQLPAAVSIPELGGDQERILFLGANPSSTGQLQLEKEYTAIAGELQKSSRFKLHISKATTRDNIGAAIAEYRPTIIHFSGHGLGQPTGFHKGGIVLEDPANRARADIMTAAALATLVHSFRPKVPLRLVVLNACETAGHAAVVAQSGVRAIGMKEEVADGRAIAFATGFYRGLELDPDNVDYAFGLGVAELAAQQLVGAMGVPVVV